MSLHTLYAVFVRREDHTLAVLEFSSDIEFGSDIQTNQYVLLDGRDMQTVLGVKYWTYNPAAESHDWGPDDVNTLPEWLKLPSSEAEAKFIADYKPENGPIPVSNNVTTFVPYNARGQLMGHLRSYVSPKNNPILDPAMPSMHGGQIDSADFPKDDDPDENAHEFARIAATVREEDEELGVNILVEENLFLGSIYDRDTRRFNFVHRVIISYDDALVREFIAALPPSIPPSLRKELGEIVRTNVIEKLLYGEGVGRFGLDRLNLDRAIELKALTSISLAILETFPELKPEPSPAA